MVVVNVPVIYFLVGILAFGNSDGKPTSVSEDRNVLNMAVDQGNLVDQYDYEGIDFGANLAALDTNGMVEAQNLQKSSIDPSFDSGPDATADFIEEEQVQQEQQEQEQEQPSQQRQLRRPVETDWGLSDSPQDQDAALGQEYEDRPMDSHQEQELIASQNQSVQQQQQQQQQNQQQQQEVEQPRLQDQQQHQMQHQGLHNQQLAMQQQQEQGYQQQDVQQQTAREFQQQPRDGNVISPEFMAAGSDVHEIGLTAGNQEPVGVTSPESMVHGADVHSADNTRRGPGSRGMSNSFQAEENKELRALQPQVLPNVHDNAFRHAAEVMKGQQFRPLDIESVLHGGHDVHGDHSKNSDFRAGDMENAMHGDRDVHGARRHDNRGPDSTIDPEQLMHGGHHANSPQNKEFMADNKYPGVETPEELFHRGQDGDWGHDHHGNAKPSIPSDKSAFKPNAEMAVHGQDHVHDHENKDVTSHKITYKDIQALGLDDNLLKGIDLSRLLEADQQDFEDWAKAQGDDSFWTRAKELREQYLTRLTSHIREIQRPDLETAEWDPDFDPRDRKSSWTEVHAGESPLEHQMELVGSTAPRGNQRPFHDKFQQRMEQQQQHDTL